MEPLIDPYSRNLLICFELPFSPNRTSLFQQRTRLHGISGSFVSGGEAGEIYQPGPDAGELFVKKPGRYPSP